jgi:dTDP-glucose 4,6-dehydratase
VDRTDIDPLRLRCATSCLAAVVVPTFIRQAGSGAPLTVAGDRTQTWSLCFIDDTVDGLICLLAAGFADPVNIGGTDEITVLELAQLIRGMCGSSSPIQFVALPADDPRRRRPDVSRAARLLGWAPQVSLGEACRGPWSGSGSRPRR